MLIGVINTTRLANRPPYDLSSLMLYGDGSDGSVTLTSGTTTLTRDRFYDFLTIQSGATLCTNGYKVFVRQECIIQGTVHNDASGYL